MRITSQAGSENLTRWDVAAIVVLALVVRLAALAPQFSVLDDPDRYLDLARSVSRGEGFAVGGHPTAYRPPLYPLVLACLLRVVGDGGPLYRGIAALHVGLGVLTAGFTALAARRWLLGRWRALLASAVVILDPVLVAQTRSVMTETLAAFLLAATLAALGRKGNRGALLGGLWLGLASLCRPSLLPVAGAVSLAGLLAGPGSFKARIQRSVILGSATFLVLAPWALRNARALGEPVWTTTHGGWTLALANNPVYYAEVLDGPPDAVWSGPNQERWFQETVESVKGLSGPEADRQLRAGTLRFIASHPRDFLRASAARVGRFWAVAPARAVYSPSVRWLTMLWTMPLWGGLVVGLVRGSLWRWPSVSAPAMLAALALVHSVYWTDMRMRSPVVPAIALIVAGTARPTGCRKRRLSGKFDCVKRGGSEIEKNQKIVGNSSCSNHKETLG